MGQQQQQQQLYYNQTGAWYDEHHQLKRTLSDPSPYSGNHLLPRYGNPPIIIDDAAGVNETDIDDSWSLMNKIVNENGLESQIPDLPPDEKSISTKKEVVVVTDEDDSKDVCMADCEVKVKVKKIVSDVISECDDDDKKEDEDEKVASVASVVLMKEVLIKSKVLKQVCANDDDDDENEAVHKEE